jgi:hypothetical protein
MQQSWDGYSLLQSKKTSFCGTVNLLSNNYFVLSKLLAKMPLYVSFSLQVTKKGFWKALIPSIGATWKVQNMERKKFTLDTLGGIKFT